MTRKQTYLRNLTVHSTDWLRASAANPSGHMRPIHVALHLIELRRRERIAAHYADVAQTEGWA